MGIAGAALATVIARAIEVAWCIFETIKNMRGVHNETKSKQCTDFTNWEKNRAKKSAVLYASQLGLVL